MTLTDDQYAFLRAEAHRTGLSAAELVRRALDASYRPGERPRVRGFDISLGVWRSPDASVAELVRRALDASYRPHERPRLSGFDLSFGVWRSPDAAVAGRRGGGRGRSLEDR